MIRIGISALSPWYDGLSAYESRFRKDLQSIFLVSGTPFINNFTLDVKIQNDKYYGRLTYLVTNNRRIGTRMKSVILAYGLEKEVHKAIHLNSELGLGYTKKLSTKLDDTFMGALGFGVDIHIWNGLYLENRFHGLLTITDWKMYFNHTLSLAYQF